MYTYSMNLTATNCQDKTSKKNKRGKIKHAKNSKRLLSNLNFGINLTVTKVTAIETNKGTANGVVRLWERVKAERFALAMTPLVEAERLARKTERFSERPDKNG